MRQQAFDVMSSLICDEALPYHTREILLLKRQKCTNEQQNFKNKTDCTFKRIGEISFLTSKRKAVPTARDDFYLANCIETETESTETLLYGKSFDNYAAADLRT